MTFKIVGEIIVQTVRDYPKGTLIAAGVWGVASFVLGFCHGRSIRLQFEQHTLRRRRRRHLFTW